MSTHKGSIVSLIGQFHNDIYASKLEELDFDEIMRKIRDASGSGNRVRDKAAETEEAPVRKSSSGYKTAPATTTTPTTTSTAPKQHKEPKAASTQPQAGGVTGAQDVPIQDEAGLRAALADVRNDRTETNWAAFSYVEGNTLGLLGSGNGGLQELYSSLSEDKIVYGLLRVTDTIDESVTVKFVLIIWVGDKVPVVRKARITTHRGAVDLLVGHVHTDVNCSNFKELTPEIIETKISDASGSGNRVKGATAHPKAAPKTTSTSTSTKGSSGNLFFVNEAEIRSALARVRSDSDGTDWVLIGYEGNTNNVILVGHGECGLSELLPLLEPDKILYALYRTTDLIDNSITVKFVLIIWVGENVPTVRKARIVTHKGEITSFIGQYHVDVTATNRDEVDEDIIRTNVQDASGSASHVKHEKTH